MEQTTPGTDSAAGTNLQTASMRQIQQPRWMSAARSAQWATETAQSASAGGNIFSIVRPEGSTTIRAFKAGHLARSLASRLLVHECRGTVWSWSLDVPRGPPVSARLRILAGTRQNKQHQCIAFKVQSDIGVGRAAPPDWFLSQIKYDHAFSRALIEML